MKKQNKLFDSKNTGIDKIRIFSFYVDIYINEQIGRKCFERRSRKDLCEKYILIPTHFKLLA